MTTKNRSGKGITLEPDNPFGVVGFVTWERFDELAHELYVMLGFQDKNPDCLQWCMDQQLYEKPALQKFSRGEL